MSKITSTEEWSKAAIEHMRKLKDDDRYEFVHNLIFDLALYGGVGMYETLGILEAIKSDLIESFKSIPPECNGECDNCNLDKE